MWPAAVFSTTILFVFYILARNMRQRCLAPDARGERMWSNGWLEEFLVMFSNVDRSIIPLDFAIKILNHFVSILFFLFEFFLCIDLCLHSKTTIHRSLPEHCLELENKLRCGAWTPLFFLLMFDSTNTETIADSMHPAHRHHIAAVIARCEDNDEAEQ